MSDAMVVVAGASSAPAPSLMLIGQNHCELLSSVGPLCTVGLEMIIFVFVCAAAAATGICCWILSHGGSVTGK